MKKVVTILLWVAIIFQVLYVIGAIPVTLIALFGDKYMKVRAMEALFPTLKFDLVVVFEAACKIIGAIVLLTVMAAKKKNIVVEIIAIVLFSGIGTLLLIPENLIIKLISESSFYLGIYGPMVYQRLSEGFDYIAVLNVVPTVLIPVAAAFSIAYKKYVAPDEPAKVKNQ